MRCGDPHRCLFPLQLGSCFTDLPCLQEEFARWEDLTLKRALDRMTDITYCPRCR